MQPDAGTRRFYKTTTVATRDDGSFGVRLDSFQLRTPARAILSVPTQALAQAIADEWEAQGTTVLPVTMPVTRLANLAQDRGLETHEAMANELAAYGRSDLVCYRTPAPEGLARKQAAHWDRLLDWFAASLGERLAVTDALVAIEQPPTAIEAIHARASAMNHWTLTATTFVTGLAGSAVIGLMMAESSLSADDALAAIRIEEDWNAAIWGRDDEEAAQANARLADLKAAELFFRTLA